MAFPDLLQFALTFIESDSTWLVTLRFAPNLFEIYNDSSSVGYVNALTDPR